MNAISALGVGFTAFSCATLNLGDPRSMGPGMFPAIGGTLLLASSLAVSWQSSVLIFDIRRYPPARPAFPRDLAAIVGSLVVFAVAVPRLGTFAGVILTTLTACLAGERSIDRRAILLALSLAIFCCWLFITILGVPLRVLPG
jgi:hypothetical protein